MSVTSWEFIFNSLLYIMHNFCVNCHFFKRKLRKVDMNFLKTRCYIGDPQRHIAFKYIDVFEK